MQAGRHAVHLRVELVALAKQVLELPLLLVSAPGGSGKSTLLAAWREALEADGVATAWIDLAPLHANPGSFLVELAGEVNRAAPPPPGDDGFGATLLRRLPHLDAPEPHQLSRWLADELRELAEPVAIFLDNYHRLPEDCPLDALLSQALRDGVPGLHLVVATRGARPSATARLLTEERAAEVGPDDLSLRAEQVQQLLGDRGIALEGELLPRLLAQTRGWATGVLLAARVIAERRSDDPERFVADLAQHEDLFSYVASELLAGESEEVLRLLEQAALLGPAPRPVLEALATPGAGERVDAALARGLLLREGGRVGLHQLWEALLRDRLRRRLDAAALSAEVEPAVRALEAAGETERAIERCVELDQPELGVRLLEQHGLTWVERGSHENVSRWISALGLEDHDSPDLALVRGLLDGRHDTHRAIDALAAAADRFRDRGDAERELAALHNALILAANENLDGRARRLAVRIVRPRRLIASREARSTALLFMAVGALLNGRYRFGRRVLDRAARYDFSPRERGGVTLARAQIAIAAGDWERGLAATEESLSDPDQRSHGPAYFALRSMAAFIRGVLGRDVDGCLEQLAEAREAFRDFRLAVSEAESAAFTGLLLLREGRAEDARDALERARHLYEELEVNEGSANLHALLARLHRELGQGEAVRRHAQTCLEIHDRTRGLRRRPWSGALAARWLAEEGEIDDAAAFVRRHAHVLDTPDLPASQQATQLALARIAHLAGDDARCGRHLQRAHEAAAAADLRTPLPDVDAALLSWATQCAALHGIEASSFGYEHARREAADTPALRIQTLGGFRVERDGTAVNAKSWRGTNPQRLLQRLLVAGGRPLSRELLGVDFWPDATPAKARGSLRAALMRLRQALEPGRAAGDPERWLRMEGEQLAVREEALAAWDVTAWSDLLERAKRESGATALDLRCEAVRRYGGSFLPETLDDWALELRRDLEARFARAGHEATAELLGQSRPQEAAELADCLLAQDPADEAAWCCRVEAEIARGERRAAERTLAHAADALRRELDAEPGAELQALADRVAKGS